MDFKQQSPSKPAAIKRTKSATTLKTKRKGGQTDIGDFAQPTQPMISNPISRKRSLQQIAAEEDAFDNSRWGDTDDEDGDDDDADNTPDYQKDEVDPIVLSGDETEQDEEPVKPAKRRKSAAGVVSGGTSKGVGTRRKDVVGDGRLIVVSSKKGSESTQTASKGKEKDTPNRSDSETPIQKCLLALQAIINKVSAGTVTHRRKDKVKGAD